MLLSPWAASISAIVAILPTGSLSKHWWPGKRLADMGRCVPLSTWAMRASSCGCPLKGPHMAHKWNEVHFRLELMNINFADTVIKWQVKILGYSIASLSWWYKAGNGILNICSHLFIPQICIENLCIQCDAECWDYT